MPDLQTMDTAKVAGALTLAALGLLVLLRRGFSGVSVSVG